MKRISLSSIPLRSAVAVGCALALLAGCDRDTAAPGGAGNSSSGRPGADGRGQSAPTSPTTPMNPSSPTMPPAGGTTPDAGSPASAGSSVGMSGGTMPSGMAQAGGDAERSSASTAMAPGAGGSAAGAMAGSKLAAADAKFISDAAGDGMYEVAVGKLAADKAGSAEVKAFGQMLVEHHTAANDKLKQVAAAHGITPPPAVPADKQKKIDRLSALSGAAFDKQFIQTVGIDDHRLDIAAFDKASKNAKADDVRAFATETLPTLRSHLDAAQKLVPGGASKGAKS